MGLITNILLENAAWAAGAVALEKVNKKHGNKATMNKLIFDNYLYVDKKTIGKRFVVLDKNSKKKYKVSISKLFKECTLEDLNGKSLGRAYGHGATSYSLYKGGAEIGYLRIENLFKQIYTISNKNWIVKRDSLFDISVKTKNGEELIRIHDVSDRNRFIIEYKNIEHEIIAILIFGAFRIYVK
jgi:hypothetical protein